MIKNRRFSFVLTLNCLENLKVSYNDSDNGYDNDIHCANIYIQYPVSTNKNTNDDSQSKNEPTVNLNSQSWDSAFVDFCLPV